MFEIHRCLPHLYGDFIHKINEPYFDSNIDLFSIVNEYYVLINNLYDQHELVCFGMIRGWDKDERWDEKVLGVYTHPLHRGRGFATMMMHWLEFIAKQRGLKSLRLHVDPKNTRALNLYNKVGYVDSGEQFKFMNIMRKSI